MAMAANAAKLETPLLADYALEPDAVEGWATAIVEYLKTMGRLPGTDAIFDGLKVPIMGAMTGMSAPGAGALAIQAGFLAAWAGIAAQAAALYATATTATPPPLTATIAALLVAMFPVNLPPTVTKSQAATAIATVLSTANATGGLWVLPLGVTAPIV
jgi:hypothetical protein